MTRINLNVASQEELTEIEGIDPVLAQALVESRRSRAGFRSWDDVRGVAGMDELSFERLRRLGTLVEERGAEDQLDEQLEVPGDVSGEAAAQRVLSRMPRRPPA